MKDALHHVGTEDATEVAMPDDVAVIASDLENTPSLGSKTAPAAALLLAACGGGGGGDSGGGAPPPAATVLKPATDAEAARFILQASLSVSTAEIASIRSIGFEPWLDEQINAPIAQTGVAWLASRGYDQVTSANFFDNEYPGDYMIWNQLLSQPNGVRKRVALALSEFFVVSLTGLDFSWRSQAIAFHWDQLNANAFGNFRKMLEDVTLNPAMGYYLSTRGNRKEDTRTGRVPDENYAREVMQLFTIGLTELNIDGTPRLGSNGQPIETYTNNDVTNLARVFTGYDWDFTGNVRTPSTGDPNRLINNTRYVTQPMTLDPTKWERPSTTSQHSTLEVNFLGTNIPANTDGTAALKTALDALFNHANVGPFFARQMIQRLVTSNPSPAYVERVARVFNNNGSGTRGDLRAVFKAIFMDSDARSAASLTAPTFGKVREPMLRFTQWGRTFGATSTSGNWTIANTSDAATRLGQSPLRSPSVFNFFRPGYVPANTAIATNSLVAPEFQIVNETSTSGYVNFMASSIGTTNGVNNDVRPNYTNELAIAHDSTALLDRLSLLLTANQLSDANKTAIKTALDATTVTQTSSDTDKLRRIHAAITLVMASPEYLVQK
ncbi:MAG: DUF1800 domain-containing protein [Sphingopyxis sp.]|nr:DUF1800 domain-containing protein [Sphingopyxis sp.]